VISRGASLVALSLLCAAPAAAGLPLAPTSDVDSSLVPPGLPLETDGFGNVFVRFGSGKPVTLVAVRRDVPAYFVSSITPDGYLRLQNQGTSPSPLWDQFQVGRRVFVTTRDGRVLPGVVAAPNTHFRRGDDAPIPEATVDDLWVDVGAESDAEVRAMGIEVLSLVTQASRVDPSPPLESYARLIGPGASIVAGGMLARYLIEHRAALTPAASGEGTVVFAWIAQGSVGGRGVEPLVRRFRPDRALVVAPYVPVVNDSLGEPTGAGLGGVWLSPIKEGKELSDWREELTSRLRCGWRASRPDPISVTLDRAGIPTLQAVVGARNVGSPGEITATPYFMTGGIDAEFDPNTFGKEGPQPGSLAMWPPLNPSSGTHPFTWSVLSPLVAAQGISEHEGAVRDTVLRLIPRDLRASTDAHGNVIVRWGVGEPRRAFMAHMDEIGYEIANWETDGSLSVAKKGGFYDWLYEGEIVRRDDGRIAVVSPREDYLVRPRPVIDSPLSDRRRIAPSGYRGLPDSLVRIDTGDSSPESQRWAQLRKGRLGTKEETRHRAQLTVVKSLARMGPHRVAGRSLDDRFGCTALILALRELARSSPPRDGSVLFAFTVEEETGLKGAEGLADDLAAAGELPPLVHAVDTFVSSDTPLEDQRYGYAKLGKGMVIRAVDTGSAAPQAGVEAVRRVAAKHGIPLQFGITSGGNDGQMFSRWGSVNVPLGWPLRYSHTQVETADLRDLEALARMVTELARTKPGQE